jgi:hypothetical protein
MWQNILIIFIIILFSYIFTLKDTKYFDLQMLFILLSLSSIVIYKLMFLKKLNQNENFDNHTNQNEIGEFVKNEPQSEEQEQKSLVNPSLQLNQLQSQIEELTLQIDNLTKKKKEDLPNIEGTRSISDSITNQDYELSKLENEIENLKEQLFFTTEENQKKEYKKIKVINSCEPLPKKEGGVTKISVSQTKIPDSEEKKQDFFKMLLEKLSETGFKLNLNLV